MVKTHDLLLQTISLKGRLLTGAEALDFYIEHVKRKSYSCSVFSLRATDYTFADISRMADSFYVRALGRLLLEGRILPSWIPMQEN